MKKSITLVSLLILFLIPQIGFGYVKITYKGHIIYIDEIPSCAHIISMPAGAKCDDLAITNPSNGNGDLFVRGWKKKMQKSSEQYVPLRKIKRARVKKINGKKKVYFRKWFLGKRHTLGVLNE